MKTALATGASSGIGLELAKLFAADGYRVVMVSRAGKRLDTALAEVKKVGEARAMPADLSDPEVPAKLVGRLQSENIQVHALVNGAGYGINGPFNATSISDERAMIQVNVTTLTELTKRLIPDMITAGSGRILNVASTAAFFPGPLMSVYYASKAYVLSFTAAVDSEFRSVGITATCLCPGPTRTEFAKRSGIGRFSGRTMDAAAVARAGYRGMQRGKRTVVPGWRNKLVTFGTRFVSRRQAAELAKRSNFR